MIVRLDPVLVPIVSLGVLAFEGLSVLEADARLDRDLAEAAERARSNLTKDTAAVRVMYRRVGLDPTKNRPSSEALLRRVRRSESLPRINSLVDICNWCSLELAVPYGLYDADRVYGEIELRLGRPGEAYTGIRKDVVHVEGRMTLADAEGPFGNPTSDSARTMVTTAVTRALMAIFMPREIAAARLPRALDLSSERVIRFCGGHETLRLTL